MNLTVAEAAELPLAAALFNGDDLLASTPEWSGAAPGAVSYRARGARLVVGSNAAHPACAPVLTRLLDEVEGTALGLPRRQALRARMLAASLRVVAGRASSSSGTSADVLEHACAGIAARTALSTAVEDLGCFGVVDPAVAALVLVQFASNAERHERARSVSLFADRQAFTVSWDGVRRGLPPSTARRRGERSGWGLGFARIAADSIGGQVYPPADTGAARSSATLEVGLNRLALPLALVREGRVSKATRAWDEETGLLPGAAVPAGSRTARSAAAAATTPGEIAEREGWVARTGRRGTWVAVPPDAGPDRARDVLDGMVHERALWDRVPEPGRSRIVALAAVLASLLGEDLPRVTGPAWNRRAPEVARAYGLRMAVPHFRGAGAVDPQVALFLAAEFGERLEADGDDLYLRIAPHHRTDALVAAYLAPGDNSMQLS